MTTQILETLAQIEHDEDVRILYACESGSRAWGFESADSDFDVRFLYVRRPDWYLSIDVEHRRDVIELPISEELDVNGWDLRKALMLFQKSNPPLLEWLGSPIVYREHSPLAARLRELRTTFLNPIACRYHYLRMAQNNFREYLRGPTVRVKKYFYVLRPLLAVRWIDANLGTVPTEFDRLVEAVVPSGAVLDAITNLVARKRVGLESDAEPRIAPLSEFIEADLARLEAETPTLMPPSGDVEVLNSLFREVLRDEFSS